MNNKKMSGVKEDEIKRDVKFSVLREDDIEYIAAQIGPYKELTVSECQEMTAKLAGGSNASDTLQKLRDESR